MAMTKTSSTTLISGGTTTPPTTPPSSTRTAPSSATQVETQQITTSEQIDADVSSRLTPTTKEGLGEDSRSESYDQQRLLSAQQTTQSAITIQRTQKEAQQNATPISTTDAPVNKVSVILSQKDAIPSQKISDDIQRAAQRNQRTCNHKYSLITKRCNFCGKHRDSHVYDV